MDDLTQAFYGLMPERVAAMTDQWLQVEAGSGNAMLALKRLLHTVKGEAQMLGIERCAALLEAIEATVAAARGASSLPAGSGDVILNALERLLMAAADVEESEHVDTADVMAALAGVREALGSLAGSEATGDLAAPQLSASPAAPAQPVPEAGARAAALALEAVEPVASELRRLYGEQQALHRRLAEAQRMVRALIAELKPSRTRDDFHERLTKTLGFGAQLERTFTALLGQYAANDLTLGLTIEQLELQVRSAAVVPLGRLHAQLQLSCRSAAQQLGKQARLHFEGGAEIDSAVEQHLAPALLHVVRNAVDHGIELPRDRIARGKPEAGTISVSIFQAQGNVRIVVEDDGQGIDVDVLRERLAKAGRSVAAMDRVAVLQTVFEPGITTRDEVSALSGMGVGLNVVEQELSALGGHVRVDSTPGKGTRFTLEAPASMRVDTVVPVTCGSLHCAIPNRLVRRVQRIDQVFQTSDGAMVRAEKGEGSELIPVRALAHLLGERGDRPAPGALALVIDHPSGAFVITVDAYGDPRALPAQPCQERVVRSPAVRAVVPTADGSVWLLLDVAALRAAALRSDAPLRAGGTEGSLRKHILVVEDAPVARELLCGILRSFGYRVSDAKDGQEGLSKALDDTPDLIMTDIEMPVLDGLRMLAQMRNVPSLATTPVIVLSTRADPETHERAQRLRVRAFLSKRKFVESELRGTIDACLKQDG